MRTLVYVGNFLEGKGLTPSPNVILVGSWRKEHSVIVLGRKSGKLSRFFEIVGGLIQAPRDSLVIIDVFSSLAFWFAVAASAVCKWRALKTILVFHGGNLPHRFKSNPLASRFLITNANQLVSPSDYLKVAVEGQFGQKVTVIRNPVELNQYHFLSRRVDDIKILWVRSLHHLYNPTMALRVIQELKQRGHHASLVMVGPDKAGIAEELKSTAKSWGIAHQVEFTGILPKPEWVKLSGQSNVFINTTHFDNSPVSLIEAMALGLPVVSTNVGGIPYFVNSNMTWLVDDNDHKAMVESILEMNEKPELVAQKTERARYFVETEFTLPSVLKAWNQLFKE
jgi:glycosyltransferase involved in cell wall biosynthesis